MFFVIPSIRYILGYFIRTHINFINFIMSHTRNWFYLSLFFSYSLCLNLFSFLTPLIRCLRIDWLISFSFSDPFNSL